MFWKIQTIEPDMLFLLENRIKLRSCMTNMSTIIHLFKLFI